MGNKPKTLPDGVSTGNETLVYDEGTWVPLVGGGGTPPTVTTTDCRYTRIGNTVFCRGSISIGAAGSANAVYISLPISQSFLSQCSGSAVGLGVSTTFTFELAGYSSPRDAITGAQVLSSDLGSKNITFSFNYQV